METCKPENAALYLTVSVKVDTLTVSILVPTQNYTINLYIPSYAYPTKFNQNICMKCLLPLRNWHFFFAIKNKFCLVAKMCELHRMEMYGSKSNRAGTIFA